MPTALLHCCTAAEAIVQSLMLDVAENRAIALTSTPGEGPGQDAAKWRALFERALGKLPARA